MVSLEVAYILALSKHDSFAAPYLMVSLGEHTSLQAVLALFC